MFIFIITSIKNKIIKITNQSLYTFPLNLYVCAHEYRCINIFIRGSQKPFGWREGFHYHITIYTASLNYYHYVLVFHILQRREE